MALKDALKKSMTNYSAVESDKMAWDNIQTNLKCCGIEGPSDWQGQPIPISCCNTVGETNEAPSTYCQRTQSGSMYLITTGCYSKLREKSNSNVKVLIGVGIGIAFIEVRFIKFLLKLRSSIYFFQLIGIVLACWLASTIRKENQK